MAASDCLIVSLQMYHECIFLCPLYQRMASCIGFRQAFVNISDLHPNLSRPVSISDFVIALRSIPRPMRLSLYHKRPHCHNVTASPCGDTGLSVATILRLLTFVIYMAVNENWCRGCCPGMCHGTRPDTSTLARPLLQHMRDPFVSCLIARWIDNCCNPAE